MSTTAIQTYAYKEPIPSISPMVFEVETIRLDTSCVTNQSHRSENYKVIVIEDGTGLYQMDFQQFKVQGVGMFFLSPGQVFTVESESMKTGSQMSFNKELTIRIILRGTLRRRNRSRRGRAVRAIAIGHG